MRATTVRFDDSLWAMLEREARLQGVSAAQFVRDATILRVASLAAQRGDEDTKLTVQEVAAGVLRDRGEPIEAPAAAPAPAPAPAAVLDPERLRALHGSGLLGVRDDPAFDRLTRLAGKVLEAPVALVSLIDRDRQVFASATGLDEPWATDRESPLSHSFCQHAVAARKPLLVPDAREHPVLRANLAVRDIGVVAYAGVPLFDRDGHALGTLCVFDSKPRNWTQEDARALGDLAAAAMTEIQLRRR